MKKLFILAVGGVGYVLGAKAGRERYEQIRSTANKVRNDPRVQQKTQQATDYAKQQAPVVKDKAASAATAAKDKVSGSSNDASVDDLHPDSIARQDDMGPRGDLP